MILLVIILFLLSPVSVKAAQEYESSYIVTYSVNSDNVAQVENNITLTNKTSNIYFTRYTFQAQSVGISNLSAQNQDGLLQTNQSVKGDWTIVNVYFGKPVVGIDKAQIFNLRYSTSDIVQKEGQIREINIPRLSNSDDITNYQLYLKTPLSFGEPSYIKPTPIEKFIKDNEYVYRFTKNQVTQAGISLSYGEYQDYRFNLTYHLENPYLTSGETEIALPMDTAYQKIYYSQIDPEPKNVRLDNDGNWMAKYILNPKQKLNILVSGYARLYDRPQYPQFLTDSKPWLSQQKFWVINSEIPPVFQNANSPLEIYRNVVNFLTYDYSRIDQKVNRLGAQDILQRPQQAICMEYTDLFVALARRRQIPARELNGYAYTTDNRLRPFSLVNDVLHSWPEYYDPEKQSWIQVDPTWEKTTGGVDYFHHWDFNHFALVIHGYNSEYPLPAGSYKTSTSNNKDVEIEIASNPLAYTKNTLSAYFELPGKIFMQQKTPYKLNLVNRGPTAQYNLAITISVLVNQKIIHIQSQTLDYLLPYGVKEIDLNLPQNWRLKPFTGEIRVEIGNHQFTQSFQTSSPVDYLSTWIKEIFDKKIRNLFNSS